MSLTDATAPWPTVRLGDIASISRGASPRPIASPRWFSQNSEVGWVRIADLGRSDGLTLWHTSQRLSADGIARSRLVPPGTLIMSIAATVGVPIITGIPACIHDGFVAIEDLQGVDRRYLLYLLASIRDELLAAGQTGSQANINTEIVGNITFSLPPVKEQRAIAEALLDTDRLIAGLECLIVKKQAIKQGMMRQLLTGRVRLPGYTDPWREVRLGELAQIVGGGTPRVNVQRYWDGGIAWCTPTDITSEPGRYLQSTTRTISQEGLERSAAQLLPAGSLLLCTRATVGTIKIAKTRIATNQGFKSLVPYAGTSGKFLYYKLLGMRKELAAKGTGSTFLEVSKRDVAGLEFRVPGLEEQEEISSVLSNVDDEIEALDSRRAKAHAIKQGMIQQLLTGKTRLPVEGDVEA